MAKAAWLLIQILIGYNLVLPLLVYLIYQAVHKKTKFLKSEHEADYAIIVTAYNETAMLHDVVQSILNTNYSNYIIYIVADNCDISNLTFNSAKVVLLNPPVTLSSNIKSHFFAISNFIRDHERLTIIDSDNLVHQNYLNELNKYFDSGYKAVQGVREAKNLNTTYACLDAARDIYYHFYDGKVLFGAGSSATLAGSGMAFTTDLYRECWKNVEIDGAGFDKVLQYIIVKKAEVIAFAPEAIVYDEKTTNTDQLVKQRARWINTWFKYFKYGFDLMARGIRKRNWGQFLFGVILVRPPLFIFIILSLICMLVNFWISPILSLVWLAAFLVFIGGFIVALLGSDTNRKIYRSLINIPRFMFFQLLSLMKIRRANQVSVATQHEYTDTKRTSL